MEPTTNEREAEDQTPVPNESEGQEIINLDYQLARDRPRRQISPPERYGYADLICYALNVRSARLGTKELQGSIRKQGLTEGNE